MMLDLAGLRRFLGQPGETVALADLPGRWGHDIIQVRCPGMGHLADNPRLAGWVRGAWGRKLMEAASPEARDDQPCPWAPPCALAVFFHDMGRIGSGEGIPRPYVLRCYADADGDLWVDMAVFGMAAHWAAPGADALVAALRGGLENGPELPVAWRGYGSLPGLTPGDVPPAAVLDFRTPYSLRQGGRNVTGAARLIPALGRRVSAMARWLGIEVTADWRGLKAHGESLTFDDSRQMPESWWRRARQTPDRPMPMAGRAGVLMVEGDLAPVWPLLVLGQTCHVGSHAALGMGAYDLWPLSA